MNCLCSHTLRRTSRGDWSTPSTEFDNGTKPAAPNMCEIIQPVVGQSVDRLVAESADDEANTHQSLRGQARRGRLLGLVGDDLQVSQPAYPPAPTSIRQHDCAAPASRGPDGEIILPLRSRIRPGIGRREVGASRSLNQSEPLIRSSGDACEQRQDRLERPCIIRPVSRGKTLGLGWAAHQ